MRRAAGATPPAPAPPAPPAPPASRGAEHGGAVPSAVLSGGPVAADLYAPPPPIDRPPASNNYRSTARRGCLLWGLIVVVVLGLVAFAVVRVVSGPSPEAARTGSARTRVDIGTYSVALYDKATELDLADRQLDALTMAEVTGAWVVRADGWSEIVAVIVPETEGDATPSASRWLPLHVAGLTRAVVATDRFDELLTPLLDGLPDALARTAEVNDPDGFFDPKRGASDLQTRVTFTSLPSDSAILMVQLVWDGDHPPPEHETDEVRRSLRPA